MARMLQALKNLQARSKWPAARGGLLLHLSQATKPSVPLAGVGELSHLSQPAKPPDPAPGPEVSSHLVQAALRDPNRRQLLAELAARLRQDANQSGSRTLLLVGIGPDSATHETALRVASLLAGEGGRVLLIDGDLARRHLSSDLHCRQAPGLTSIGQDLAAGELLQPTAIPGLEFLPAGTEPFANQDNWSGALARSLGELAAQFDLVLLDGGRTGDPAVGTLARWCDATYVVARLGAVQASQAQQALRELRADGARVLGCIATGGEA